MTISREKNVLSYFKGLPTYSVIHYQRGMNVFLTTAEYGDLLSQRHCDLNGYEHEPDIGT
jgi:hypothetical protein